MKDPGVHEIHEIMERIHDEEVGLTPEQRLRRLREESEAFLRERKLDLKRVKRVSAREN